MTRDFFKREMSLEVWNYYQVQYSKLTAYTKNYCQARIKKVPLFSEIVVFPGNLKMFFSAFRDGPDCILPEFIYHIPDALNDPFRAIL